MSSWSLRPDDSTQGGYNHPLMRAIRAASMRFLAPSLLIASER